MKYRESASAWRLVGVAVGKGKEGAYLDSCSRRWLVCRSLSTRALYIHPKEPYILICTPAQDDDVSVGLFLKEPYICTQKSPIYRKEWTYLDFSQDDDLSAGLFLKEPYIYTQKSPMYTLKRAVYIYIPTSHINAQKRPVYKKEGAYGVAAISTLLENIGLFCKRAL